MALTDAVCVCHAFPRHAVPPQALVHVIAGVAILHPVVRRRRDNEEYVPHSCTEQPTSHEAVHPEKSGKKEKLSYETNQVRLKSSRANYTSVVMAQSRRNTM